MSGVRILAATDGRPPRAALTSIDFLCHSERRRALVREADVVLLLEVANPWGQFNSFSDPHKIQPDE